MLAYSQLSQVKGILLNLLSGNEMLKGGWCQNIHRNSLKPLLSSLKNNFVQTAQAVYNVLCCKWLQRCNNAADIHLCSYSQFVKCLRHL